MKLQLDFDKKTIKIEGDVKLASFFEKIKQVLPDWKKWTLQTNTQIVNWGYPWYGHTYPSYPYFTLTNNSGTFSTGTGGLLSNSNVVRGTTTTTGAAMLNMPKPPVSPKGIVNMELN